MGEVIDLSQATKVADVVPLFDTGSHNVPGGYYRAPFEASGWDLGELYDGPDRWLAVHTANYPRHVQCPCYPSVQVHREGRHVGAVVVHHAFDGRASGSTA